MENILIFLANKGGYPPPVVLSVGGGGGETLGYISRYWGWKAVHQQVKSQILGMKWVFKHKDIQNVGFQIKQIWLIFIHLKLWVAVARRNFKWWEFKYDTSVKG